MKDPFALLGLSKEFSLNAELLEKAYFEAQKKTHPDQFVCSSLEEKREVAHQSTVINQAYLLLKDPLTRAEYLLEEVGFKSLAYDSAFLAEIMVWREKQEAGEDIEKELLLLNTNLFKDLENAFKEKKYEFVQRLIYKLKYIQKLLKEKKKNY